ncbi:MAG TPA: tRNA pseudouridine(55) synthase TruB [Gammaproteobacteria bacterium]|nr:tRNA pseudouridine(55) synthase TruB [Gammaproteobacteria bacterium]
MVRKRRQSGRDLSGVFLLDKPSGITSNAALQRVKRLFYAQKAGHTGSLDPLASGLLPICFGEATKFSGFLLESDKEYETVVKLGVKTNSGDAEGEIIEERAVGNYSLADIESVLKDFRGEIQQVPSMFSAIKQNGQRLYKLAHKGIEVEREPRTIQIYELTVKSYQSGLLYLKVVCSKGTYIRTLVENIGDDLGCGAHVLNLCRNQVGAFSLKQATSLEDLESMKDSGGSLDSLLLPMESALVDWPDIRLSEHSAFFLRQGQPVVVPHAPTEGWVRLYQGAQDFIGVGKILDDGRVAPKRLVSLVS